MKFGIIHDFRNPRQWRRPWPEFYRGIFDRIVRAEELGYDNVWLAEHHFADDGYNPSPRSLTPCRTGVAVYDRGGTLLWANDKFCQM